MAVDQRQKNAAWRVVDEKGSFYAGSYGGSHLAVLMDIRDELQQLNALLHCHNFVGIPTTLRSIRKAMPARRKATK